MVADTSIQSRTPHLARLDWVDVLRGVAILLVVIGHSWRGLFGAGLMDPPVFAALDRSIYSFHMPLFFMISGFFYMRSIAAPPGAFVATRLKRLLYPLVLWTYVFVLAKLAAGPFVNVPLSLSDLWVLPVPGRWHFWFLWALLLMQLALYVLRPLRTHRHLQMPVLTVVLVLSIGLSFMVPGLSQDVRPWIGGAMAMTPFFIAGIMVGEHLPRIPQAGPVPVVAVLGLLCVFPAMIMWPVQAHVPGLVIALTMSLLTISACAASRQLPDVVTFALAELGRATMAIFLLHTFFSAALREGLLIFGWTDLGTHMLLSVAIGVCGPLAVFYLTRRLGWMRVLGF